MILRPSYLLALGLALGVVASTDAQARDLVGTGFVDNKIVQLFDDGTWEFLSKPLPAGCSVVSETIQFCDAERGWRVAGGPKYEFDQIYSDRDKFYAGILSEDFGSADDINLEYMISVALEGAAEVSGVSVEEVPVHSITKDVVDGHSGDRVVYGSLDNGVKFVFANTIIIKQHLTLQAMSWTVGSEFSDDHQDKHLDFIGKIRVTYEDPLQ